MLEIQKVDYRKENIQTINNICNSGGRCLYKGEWCCKR